MAAAAMAAARREAERTVLPVRAVRVLPEMRGALRYRFHDSLELCVASRLERANLLQALSEAVASAVFSGDGDLF